VDPLTNKPIYWTKDERDDTTPNKPFPADWEYLRHYFDTLLYRRLVVVQKCRQMYVSTATLAFILWHCLFAQNRRWLISKVTEDNAKELLRDKVRYPYSQLPEWFRELYPASDTPENRMDFDRTKSWIGAVAENAASRHLRGGTASGVLVDEAAFQREYKKIWRASMPMAARLVAVSTPEIGNPGAQFMKQQVTQQLEEIDTGVIRRL
jgi:hypothetical protein